MPTRGWRAHSLVVSTVCSGARLMVSVGESSAPGAAFFFFLLFRKSMRLSLVLDDEEPDK